jgi:hypothetical protein
MKYDAANYNLEQDMQSASWFLEKLSDQYYAQNIYAAICNNKFYKTSDSLAILTDDPWTASWRTAGQIVAKLRNRNEDYLDYYCSGINFDITNDLLKERYVEESFVTDEVREDILKLGWIIKSYD